MSNGVKLFLGTVVSLAVLPMAKATPLSLVSFSEMELLAKYSLSEEALYFSDQLVAPTVPSSRVLRKSIELFRESGIRSIDPEYLYDKCIFEKKDFESLRSDRLTLADDETYRKKDRLSEVFELYGKRFYRTILSLCEGGRSRFQTRLKTHAFKGTEVRLTSGAQKLLVEITFYPTGAGKRGFLEFLNSRDLGFAFKNGPFNPVTQGRV